MAGLISQQGLENFITDFDSVFGGNFPLSNFSKNGVSSSSLFGGLYDAFTGGDLTQQRSKELIDYQNAFSASEAQKQRDFEKSLSDTAIARGVADAKNAGLNPYAVLSNALQASSPAGASASSGSARATANTSLMNGLTSAFSTIIGGLIKANTSLADNNTALTVAKLYNTVKKSPNVEIQYLDPNGVIKSRTWTKYHYD